MQRTLIIEALAAAKAQPSITICGWIRTRRDAKEFSFVELNDGSCLANMPAYCVGDDETYVGRIREDETIDNGLNLWVVADNVRKGAALNAVQIGEELLKRNLVRVTDKNVFMIKEMAAEGLPIPQVKERLHRPICSACGKIKRHYFNKVALDEGFDALATGHNLDDEVARLFSNTLRWDTSYLSDQGPRLDSEHGFARKVKPLWRLSEFETANYAFLMGIENHYAPCPYSPGASFTTLKGLLQNLEAAMASGELLAVVSTSALELGIDIGGLDVCILVGYPGTVMATLQRGGRVGRAQQESAVIVVAGEDALDQYFARNPEDFFSRPPEKAVVNPDNEVILARHLECAAAEMPLTPGEPMGVELHNAKRFALGFGLFGQRPQGPKGHGVFPAQHHRQGAAGQRVGHRAFNARKRGWHGPRAVHGRRGKKT